MLPSGIGDVSHRASNLILMPTLAELITKNYTGDVE